MVEVFRAAGCLAELSYASNCFDLRFEDLLEVTVGGLGMFCSEEDEGLLRVEDFLNESAHFCDIVAESC